jgi:hypothetical protein
MRPPCLSTVQGDSFSTDVDAVGCWFGVDVDGAMTLLAARFGGTTGGQCAESSHVVTAPRRGVPSFVLQAPEGAHQKAVNGAVHTGQKAVSVSVSMLRKPRFGASPAVASKA